MNISTITTTNEKLASISVLFARVGLSAIFLLAAMNKIQNYDANAQYLAYGGLPEGLLPFVIVFELIGGLFILAGFSTQITAFAFAGFSLLTAIVFHHNLADQMQFLMFFKNLAMAGGFLALAAHGADKFSFDEKLNH